MDIFGQIPTQSIQLFILYGVTGVVPLIAAIYLLLRRGNAFAPDTTPPLRLRRWAASFFAVAAMGHVWWYLFYACSGNFHSAEEISHSVGYISFVILDCVTLLTTIAGTLLSMLQDRRRKIWPVFVALLPFVAMGGVLMVNPGDTVMSIAIAYILLLYVIFTIYMVFAVRHYGRWLNDNYADLENKKVWLSQVVTLGCLLAFILYALVDIDTTFLIYLLYFTELVLFGLLLWRVETLPQLENTSMESASSEPIAEPIGPTAEVAGSTSAPEMMQVQDQSEQTQVSPSPKQTPSPSPVRIDLEQIERLLAIHCVAPQLYLQHDISLQQLAQAVGTNRSYLSQYFSRQGITYNTYINNLRINHFISHCQELAAAGQPIVAQQIASESGFRSYSTFSRAFMQRTGQSATAWMRGSEGE